MPNSAFSFRMPEDIKTKAFAVIRQYGLTPAQAINMFMAEIANTNSIPLRLNYLAALDTLKAIEELDSGQAEKFPYEEISTADVAMASAVQLRSKAIAGEKFPAEINPRPSAATLEAIEELESGRAERYENLDFAPPAVEKPAIS